MTDPLRVLSYGGGTQSAALALMAAAGTVDPLDAVIFADTHGELPETYLYADYVERHLVAAGIPFLRVSAGSLEAALLADEPTSGNPTPPAHLIRADGEPSRLNGYRCSFDYKRRVITAEVKRLCAEREDPPIRGGRGAWKRADVEQWLGFSVDEIGRCKPADECRCGHKRLRPPAEKGGPPRGHRPTCDGRTGSRSCGCERFDPWQVNRWPLIELGYRRGDTIRWFEQNGHPTPPRSACWFCPNSRNGRWQALKRDHPDLFERACQIDERIRDGGGFNARGNTRFEGTMFLHSSRIPLRDADLRSRLELEVDAGQGDLFDGLALGGDCEAGVCFT